MLSCGTNNATYVLTVKRRRLIYRKEEANEWITMNDCVVDRAYGTAIIGIRVLQVRM